MPKVEHPLHALTDYLPENSFEQVANYLHHYKVHLTLTRQRQSVLGDYRNAVHGKNHRISINGNLNKFSFLITLLHELAHLVAFEKFGNRILAHGKEWKSVYKNLLADFVNRKIFPTDIEQALYQSMQNPAASSCAEESLLRVLRKYDVAKKDVQLLEELSKGSLFKTDDGRIFEKGERLRKRFRCTEKKTGLVYLFSPVYEVKAVQ
jgi:SprT protein